MSSLERILHVEDEPDIQEIAKLALETIGGFTVKSCSSGKEALEKAPSFKPDLFLLDVMMPEMDGPTTLEELRKTPEGATTPAIFMTAKAQTHEIDHFEKLGALGVITKPFDPVSLAELIKEIWQKNP